MKNSSRVALGGVIASLCVLLMMMTGFFPFLTYAAPLLSGFLLIAVVCDCGYRWAVLVYLVVSLLSVFIVPDKQAAMVFLFLGYYPILKEYLDHKMKPGLLIWLVKFLVFNLSMIAAYGLMIYVFRMPDVMAYGADGGSIVLGGASPILSSGAIFNQYGREGGTIEFEVPVGGYAVSTLQGAMRPLGRDTSGAHTNAPVALAFSPSSPILSSSRGRRAESRLFIWTCGVDQNAVAFPRRSATMPELE